MKRSSVLKILFFLMLVPGLTLAWGTWVWAHGGHDHDVEPSISLPEVLAKVNGTDIKKSALWPDLTRTVKRYKSKGIPLSREQEKVAAKKLLQDQINRFLLLKKADKMGIRVSPGKVDEEVARVKKQFISEKEFLKQLKLHQLTLDQYKQQLKEDILVDAVFRRELGEGITISRAEIEEYYKKNTQQFLSKEQRRASVILIKVDPKAGNRGERKARETLEKIVDKLKKGADFADLARQYSQDSLANRGGDMDFRTKDRMFGPFKKLAFTLKVGEVSEIFRTKHGFQIMMVTGKKEGTKGTLENERENIRALLLDRKIQIKSHPYLEALRKKADIKIYF